jgi:hypothetical protein
MKRWIEFPLGEEDETILVEVEEPEGQIIKASLKPGEVIEKASMTLDQALEKLKPAAAAIIAKMRTLADSPDEMEVKFGIKLNAQAGAVIAAASVEANYTISLIWKRKEKKTV